MIRMTRLTDYGIVLLSRMAYASEQVHNARDLALDSHLPLPTVIKVLKMLTRKGLLLSHRGAKGGYSLARRPDEISVAQVIDATEGPVALTECTGSLPGTCQQEGACPVQGNWERINRVVRDALQRVSLLEMSRPSPVPLAHLRRPGDQASCS
jgi:FeS assembly SUF system regulator